MEGGRIIANTVWSGLTRIVPGGIGQNLGAPRGDPLCSDVALDRYGSVGTRQQITVPIKAMAV